MKKDPFKRNCVHGNAFRNGDKTKTDHRNKRSARRSTNNDSKDITERVGKRAGVKKRLQTAQQREKQ